MKREVGEFQERVLTLHDELVEGGYDGRQNDVRRLIDEGRRLLVKSEARELGPWEASELDYAGAAARANYLCLALVAVNKAVEVGELPQEEYDYGFNYGRK